MRGELYQESHKKLILKGWDCQTESEHHWL